jgi:putative hemolysin
MKIINFIENPMKHIDVKSLFLEKEPNFLNGFPKIFQNLFFTFLRKLVHENELNNFLSQHGDVTGINFIDEVLDFLDLSYTVSNRDRARIPMEGKVLIVSNHPLGGLDGLALLKLVCEFRQDVKIVVNDIMLNIENLNEFFLPVDIINPKAQKNNLENISSALRDECAVIIFPAGEVSRFTTEGIKDKNWNKGVLYFAKKCDSDILPIFIHARNSFFFYLVSALYKNASTLLLPSEMLRKRNSSIMIKIGEPITAKTIMKGIGKSKLQIKLLQKHIDHIGKDKPGIFKTSKAIVHPLSNQIIRRKINESQLIGETYDGKQLFLVEPEDGKVIIQEIARLREITFRKVGEGTGSKTDIDKFDKLYSHLVLWDNKDSEIIGAYRIGICKHLLRVKGIDGLYTSTLFDFSQDFIDILPDSIELGRSFIQAKYWNTNALDLLWKGLGTFIASKPYIKYLFGSVSISSSFPLEASSMIVFFYKKWFGYKDKIATSMNSMVISESITKQCESLFNLDNFQEEYKILKSHLKQFDVSVPPLIKHYTNLCTEGGVNFLDFGIDPNFSNCIDGLILVDVSKMKSEKKSRYMFQQQIDKVA